MRRVVVQYVVQLFFEVMVFQIYFDSTLLALQCLAARDLNWWKISFMILLTACRMQLFVSSR